MWSTFTLISLRSVSVFVPRADAAPPLLRDERDHWYTAVFKPSPPSKRFARGIASRYCRITPLVSGATRNGSQAPPAGTASEQSAFAGVLASGPNTLE